MSEHQERFVPPTWTWEQAARIYEMDVDELKIWVAERNEEYRKAGRLEPFVISDDDTRVTPTGSPREGT